MAGKRTIESNRTGLFVNGEEVPNCLLQDVTPDEHVRQLLSMKIRDDDVLVAAYPKCGTHWLWEILHMLLNKTTVHESRGKEYAMMEFCNVSLLDAQESPRVLNSHLFCAHLPEEMFSKKIKIFHVVRNPKDVLVSMYYHFRRFIVDLTWERLLEEIMSNAGNIQPMFSYLRQMNKYEQDHPDHSVKLVYYEDMKRHPVKIIQELAEYLDVTVTEAFCQEVALACDFGQMKLANRNKSIPEHLTRIIKNETDNMYRKGIIGDWKNHFTVAQNEAFDAYIKQEMKGLPFVFTYE